MADLAILSTVASTISGTQSAFELAAKATPRFACSDAHDYLNQALAFRTDTLKIVEKYQDILPHVYVHQWKIEHTDQLKAWQNLQAELDTFDSFGIFKKTFSIFLRKRLINSAFKHVKDCRKSWTRAQVMTDSARSQIASRIARVNGVLALDFPAEIMGASQPRILMPPALTTSTSMPLHPTQHHAVPIQPGHTSRMNPFISPAEQHTMSVLQPRSSSGLRGTSENDSSATA